MRKLILIAFLTNLSPLFGDSCIPKQVYTHKLGKQITAISQDNQSRFLFLPKCEQEAHDCDTEYIATLMKTCCYRRNLAYVPYGNTKGFCY